LSHRRLLVDGGRVQRMLEPNYLARTLEHTRTHGVLDSGSAQLAHLENRTNSWTHQRCTREGDIPPRWRKEPEPGGDDITKTLRQHQPLARFKVLARSEKVRGKLEREERITARRLLELAQNRTAQPCA